LILPEIENNRSIRDPKVYLDRMSVAASQNHRPLYCTATLVSVGGAIPLDIIIRVGEFGISPACISTNPGAALPGATSA